MIALLGGFGATAYADATPSISYQQDLGWIPKPETDAKDDSLVGGVPPQAPLIHAPDDPAEWDAWRAALKQWRKDSKARVGYDDALYVRSDLTWTASSYSSCFIMMNDLDFWDPVKGEYTVESFLERGVEKFGGYDSVVIWHAYPRIGIDDRNQFDFYRDMPGGLEGVKKVVDRFHALGVEVFIDYNPWDTDTRREPKSDVDSLVDFVRITGTDGVYLDTMETGAGEFRAKLDAVRPGLVLEGEGKLPVENIDDHHMSWCEWCSERDSKAPGVLRDKFFERRHMMHQNNRHETNHMKQLHIAWMNGSGILVWENVFGLWVGWPERDASMLRAMLPIQRRYTPLFAGEGWTPLVPTEAENVYASLWEADGLRLWTLVNRLSRKGVSGELLRVPHVPGAKYYNLFTGQAADVKIAGGEAILSGAIMMEGLGGFISGKPEAFGDDFDEFLAAQAALHARSSDSLDYPGRYAYLTPMERTPRVDPTALPEGMIAIPATTYNGETKMRIRETSDYNSHTNVSFRFPQLHYFVTFPKRNIRLSAYAIDETPVTNAQYHEFLKASGYAPRYRENFLKHWIDGKPAPGQEDHPVVYVDLDDARAYAQWAGKRLVTEEEWQYAAEGPDALVYPWGNEWEEGMCNANRVTGSTGGTTGVRDFPDGRSPFGLYDMCGNVYEWTESERSDGRTRFSMLRGGSYYQADNSAWYTDGAAQPCNHAEKFILMWPGMDRCATVGFRCAVDLTSN